MTTNDPVLEVLREIRGDLGRVTTELGRLVRHAEYTNSRLDEHGDLLREHGTRLESLERHAAATVSRLDQQGEILREHGGILREHGTRLESLDRHSVATVAAIDVLYAGVRAIVPALEQGRLRDDRLLARVDECERRIDVLEQR
jgi:chromosome segregation ATPase